MTSDVILDTGPLIAILDRDEANHDWATAQLKTIRPPLHTCDAVLTEACFLLRHLPSAIDRIERFCSTGVIATSYSSGNDSEAVFALMRKYRDLPMSFADASVVRMVETGIGRIVFTLDDDFKVYRQKRRRKIDLISP